MQMISLVASGVSLVIGTFAIWLSVTFYRMSSENSKDIKQASAQINTTVKRLEVLLEKLYADTFSMVKDTVSDMRAHIWRAPRVVDASDKDNRIIEQFSSQIEEILKQQSGTTSKVDELSNDIEKVLEQAIKEKCDSSSRTPTEELQTKVLAMIPLIQDATIPNISRALMVNDDEVASAVFGLGRKNTVTWSHAPNEIHSEDLIELIDNKKT